MDTKIIAHRGASGLVNFDNSIESFRKAIEVGADMVEFDVRKTKDGRLIVFHDPKIDGKDITSLTYTEILDKTEAKGYKVPRLEDVILLCKDKIGLDIELKEEGYESHVIDLVSSHLDYDQFIMKSFSDKTVKKIKNYDSKIETGLLLGVEDPENKVRTRLSELFPKIRVRSCDADFISPNYQLLRLLFLQRMNWTGKDIYVWTVNDVKMMEKLFKKGVEAIITDRPDIAVEAKRRR